MKPQAGLALPFYGPRDVATVTRERLEILTDEMASQRTSDPGRALRSDFSEVSRLSSSLQRLDALSESATLAQTWGKTLQAAMGSDCSRVGPTCGRDPGNGRYGVWRTGRASRLHWRGRSEEITASLGQTLNGRALFGNGTTQAVSLDIDTVLSDINAVAAAASDFNDYLASVDTYFDAGGPFESTQLGWLSAQNATFEIGDGEQATFRVDAGAGELRDALKQAVLTAGLANAGFTIRTSDRLSQTLQPDRLR